MASPERAVETPTQPSPTLSVGASNHQLGVLRALVRTAAAQYPLSVDALTDLVLAVDEAATTLIGHARAASDLTCTFDVDTDHRLNVGLAVRTSAPINLSATSFGWIVLQTLVDDVALEQSPTNVDEDWVVKIILSKALQAGS